MANDRLRAAMSEAGVDDDQLAKLVGVQPETVARWLGGRWPYRRHRAAVARALGRPERELWPEPSNEQTGDDLRQEILGAWGHVDDARTSDWRALLHQASAQIDLAGHRLDEILGSPGTVELLSEKAGAGCRIRVVPPAADSLWLAEAARRTGKGKQDYVGRTELHRQVELAIGYLQPLLEEPGVDARASYEELSIAVLRFDHHMILTLMLGGAEAGQRPLLHLKRESKDGLFDQLAGHVEALHRRGVRLERDPELYPDPSLTPQRYQPVTERTYRGQLMWLDRQLGNVEQTGPPAGRTGKRRRPPRR
jgi:transcriptional regulator with XRE-family HTH domain